MSSPGCTTTTNSAMECHQLCTLTKNCMAFTWLGITGATMDRKCCFKTAIRNLWPLSGAISGSHICGGKYDSSIQVFTPSIKH